MASSTSQPPFYQLGRFIDAKDSVNKWCAAKVVRIDEASGLTVQFDGWSHKWDEKVSFRSSRIAPFRRHSRLYTGQIHTAIRDWSFSMDELQAMQTKVEMLIGNEITMESAYETTQFLRGDLFTFVDCLMTASLTNEQATSVLLFFTKVLDLILSWAALPDLFPLCYCGLSNPDLFLTDQRMAVALAYPELIFTLERLFAGDERTVLFYRQSEAVPMDYEPGVGTAWGGTHYRSLVFVVNYFVKQGGLARGLELLRNDGYVIGSEFRIPIEILSRLPFHRISKWLTLNTLSDFLSQWKPAILTRLQSLSDRDVKDFDKEECISVLEAVYSMSLLVDKGTQGDWMEEMEMKMALAMVKCQYLEKRIRGVNDFKELIQRTSPQSRAYPSQSLPKRVSKRTLLTFFIEQNVLNTIIADRPHAEILKRSGEVFSFYAENGILTEIHMEMLWASRVEKHESHVRAVYEVLVSLSSCLSLSLKDSLFHKFSEVSADQYDSKFLRLLKDFSLQANSTAEVIKDYALPLFFTLMLDDPRNNPQLADLSQDLLLELLKTTVFKTRQEDYLDLALSTFVRGESIPQCLSVALGILRTVGMRSVVDLVKKLDKKFRLVTATVDSLCKYAASARGVVAPVTPDSLVNGRTPHSTHLSTRFRFLEFSLESLDKSNLSPEQVSLLWDSFVCRPASPYDSDVYFTWLASSLDSRSILTRDNIESIFEKYLGGATFDVRKVSEAGFACFTKYFLVVNSGKRRVECRGNAIVTRMHAQIIGFIGLFSMAIYSTSEIVSEKAVRLVVDLYLRLGRSVASDKESLWKDLLDLLITKAREDITNTPVIGRILCVIGTMLDEAEGRGRKKGGKGTRVVTVYYRMMTENEYKKIEMDAGGTVGDVRRILAEAVRKHLSSVSITISSRLYTRIDDDLPLSSFRSSIVAVIDISHSSQDYLDPKPLLSNHFGLLDLLFELISQSDPSTADLAWGILMRLPTNEKIRGEIGSLKEGWKSLLRTKSLHKLLYCLIIIDELSEANAFARRFQENKGVSVVFDVFFDTKLERHLSSALVFRYSVVILRLLIKFLPSESRPDRVLTRTLSLILETSPYLATPEAPSPAPAEALETVTNASVLIFSLISVPDNKPMAAEAMRNYTDMKEFLAATLLLCADERFGEGVREMVAGMSRKLRIEREVLEALLALVQLAVIQPSGCRAYFSLTAALLKAADMTPDFNLQTVSQSLIASLTAHKCEKSATDQDEILCGIILLLRAVIKRTRPPANSELVQLLVHTCLFEVGKVGGGETPPKCKHAGTRKEALKLLNVAMKGDEEMMERVTGYLGRLHQDPHWRTSRRQDWNNHPSTMERSDTGFVGLKNLGCTCYLNSTLQQLFMLPSFRQGVLAAPVALDSLQEDSLLYQLQSVFTALQESEKQYVSPKGLTKAFRPDGEQPLNRMEQMDVDEFFNNFMDKLEPYLKHSPFPTLVQDHFGGSQSTLLIGKGSCSHRSERAEPFLTLPLEVKNKKSIYESLDSYVLGETLEGDNAYQCDHCEAKVTAERRVCIRHLPNIMIFALRRFEFDYDFMNRLKLNDYCEFPMEIDLEPYTVEGINRRNASKDSPKSPDLDSPPPRKYPEDYYHYRLRGIVIHMGTAESGHYYSFISSSSHWFEFNDTTVREFDEKEIPAEAFGGEEKWNVTTGFGTQIVSLREKYRNAYLLLYEREGRYATRGVEEDVLTPLASPPSPQIPESVTSLISHVHDDNQKFWRRHTAFTHEYFSFLLKLSSSHCCSPLCLKFLLSFFLTLFIRAKDRHRLEEWVPALRAGLVQSVEVSVWLLETLTVDAVLQELLLDCPETAMRKLVVSLGKTAIRTVGGTEAELVLVRLLRSLHKAREPLSRHFGHYFELLDCAAEVAEGSWGKVNLCERLVCHYFGESRDVGELPDIPQPRNTDIYLGYEEGRTVEAAYDKFGYETGAATSFSYLLRTISRRPSLLQSPSIQPYFRSPSFLQSLIEGSSSKVAITSLSRIFAHLCADNSLTSESVISSLLASLSRLDFDRHKPIFHQLLAVVSIADSLTMKRVELTVDGLMRGIRENDRSLKATESCIEFVYWKLYVRMRTVREFLTAHPETLDTMKDWVQRGTASLSAGPPLLMYIQRGGVGGGGGVATYVQRQSGETTELARKMVNGEIAGGDTGWDSEEELRTERMTIGDRLDVFNATYARWDRGTLVHNFNDILLVRTDLDKALCWIESDSDMVAPEGTKVIVRPEDC